MPVRPNARTRILASGPLILLIVALPAAGVAQEARVLKVTGSSTMCPMVEALGKQFQELRPQVRIAVECGGSDRGIKDVREGSADIGMIARALKTDEKDLQGFPMARDGVSVIVNAKNPVTALSPGQIAGVFSGKIVSWRELGGEDRPIAVILRELDKPATELFEKHFDLKGSLKGTVIPGDNQVTVDAVAAAPDAIGYLSSGEAERRAASGIAIRPLPLGGVTPTSRNILTGNYPLTRSLSLITKGLPTGAAKEFVNFCLSSSAVETITRFDFVPYED